MESGIIFGLTAALHGRIDFVDGRVRQSNFHDYRMLKLADVPEIDVHIVPSHRISARASARPACRRLRRQWPMPCSRLPA